MKKTIALASFAAALIALGATTASAADWWNSTKISGQMFYDLSNIDATSHTAAGVKTDSSENGTGFDLKRFYIGIDHSFDSVFSANVTTDFTYDKNAGATQLFLKKAYLQAKFDPALIVRVGAAPTAWLSFSEHVNGYRYMENMLVDRTKYGTTSDWGVHVLGSLADKLISYQFSAVNGNGYKNPSRADNMDFEGVIDLNYHGFVAGIGGYDGKLGVTHGTPTHHDATRFDALVGYASHGARLSVEYFTADNYSKTYVTSSTVTAKTDGYAVFGSYAFAPRWALVGRYDDIHPKTSTPTSVRDHFYMAGLQFEPEKLIDFALVYKHETTKGGSLTTADGTLGGSVFGPGLAGEGSYDEIGLFGEARW